MQGYVVIDLRAVMSTMEGHVTPREALGRCSCSELVSQDMNECPGCQMPIIWENSRVWKGIYGSPTRARAMLDVHRPEDKTGIRLLGMAGLVSFPTKTDLKDWNKAVRNLGQDELTNIINHCYTKGGRQNGLIRWVLNTTNKRVRELTRARTAQRKAEDADESWVPGRQT